MDPTTVAAPDGPLDALTVVVPTYDEDPASLRRTLSTLGRAVAAADLPTTVVVVDDGSPVPVAESLGDVDGAPELRIVRQENAGRLGARRTGLAEVTTDWVLFLDSRIDIDEGALAFAVDRVSKDPGRLVFNADVRILTDGMPFGRFWRAVTEIMWSRYFSDRRETSFGAEDFDHYPKGTTCFLVRTQLMRDAMAEFRSQVGDDRLVNDDTVMIRRIAEDHRIWLSPEFGCTYEPRTSAKGFFRQVFHRGTVFYDGFSRPGTRFTGLLRVFPAVSIASVAAVLRWPRTALLALLLPLATAGLAVRRRIDAVDAAVFSALSLPFAAVYSLGIWRGVLKHRLPRGQEDLLK